MKKIPQDIIILHMHTNNYDHMMYGSWETVHNRWTDRQAERKSDIQRSLLHLKINNLKRSEKLLVSFICQTSEAIALSSKT